MNIPDYGAGTVTLPALTNAHDHLSLNHFPRTRPREQYDNAFDWALDVSDLLDESPYRELRRVRARDSYFIGGLKNLLCGALTVMHHDPVPPLRAMWKYPVRVMFRYTWAHSLQLASPDYIKKAHRESKGSTFFYIHLAEGTDGRARMEYRQLAALGVADKQTVLIHGVGLTADDIAQAAPTVRALVVCPTTNRYLLNAIPPIEAWLQAGGALWIGSDSRLTADGDLLDEIAHFCQPGEPAAAALTRLRPMLIPDELNEAMPNKWIVLRENAVMPLARADLALVVRRGVPVIGDPDLMDRYGRRGHVPAVLDGREKRVDAALARQIRRCTLHESGFSLE